MLSPASVAIPESRFCVLQFWSEPLRSHAMKQGSRALAGLVIAIAFLASATAVYGGKYNSTIDIGMKAPTFANLPATDGKTYSMSDFKEDVLVVVFLANHCPWVKGGEPDLIKMVSD